MCRALNVPFIVPPDAPEPAPVAGLPPEVRLREVMRREVLDRWDGLSDRERDRKLREYGAALAVLGGRTRAELGRTSRAGSDAVRQILRAVGA